AGIKKRGFAPFWSLTSPAYVLVTASAWGRSAYWKAFVTTSLLSWTMLGLACALVPHTWQDRRRRGAGFSQGWSYAWKYGSIRRRGKLRARLLEREPVAWLACRERWQSLALWIMAVLISGVLLTTLLSDVPMGAWFAFSYIGGLLTLLLYVLAASQAVRFF